MYEVDKMQRHILFYITNSILSINNIHDCEEKFILFTKQTSKQ